MGRHKAPCERMSPRTTGTWYRPAQGGLDWVEIVRAWHGMEADIVCWKDGKVVASIILHPSDAALVAADLNAMVDAIGTVPNEQNDISEYKERYLAELAERDEA